MKTKNSICLLQISTLYYLGEADSEIFMFNNSTSVRIHYLSFFSCSKFNICAISLASFIASTCFPAGNVSVFSDSIVPTSFALSKPKIILALSIAGDGPPFPPPVMTKIAFFLFKRKSFASFLQCNIFAAYLQS